MEGQVAGLTGHPVPVPVPRYVRVRVGEGENLRYVRATNDLRVKFDTKTLGRGEVRRGEAEGGRAVLALTEGERESGDGVDLDIEETTSMNGTIRLIDRLRADFGPAFLITLAPVATGLLVNAPHLSGPEFNYHVLEAMRGHEIAWYNTQFYCGWGDANTTMWYDAIIAGGWKANQVVMGLVTNHKLGAGFVAGPQIELVLRSLRSKYPDFGGVMGWEYFTSLPGGEERPWEWAANMARTIRTPLLISPVPPQQEPSRSVAATLPAPPHPFPAGQSRLCRASDHGATRERIHRRADPGRDEDPARREVQWWVEGHDWDILLR